MGLIMKNNIQYPGVGSGEGSGLEISQLDDVKIIPPLKKGESLVYNTENNKWENKTSTGVTSLAALTDISLTEVEDGQTLIFNEELNKWINAESQGGGTSISYTNIVNENVKTFTINDYANYDFMVVTYGYTSETYSAQTIFNIKTLVDEYANNNKELFFDDNDGWTMMKLTTEDGNLTFTKSREKDARYVVKKVDLIKFSGGGSSIEPAIEGTYAESKNLGLITPIPVSATDKVEITFDYVNYQNNCCIFSTTRGTEGHNTLHLTTYANAWYVSGGNGESHFGTATSGAHTYIFNDDNNNATMDGEIVINNAAISTGDNIYYVLSSRGNTTNCSINARYYNFKVTDKTTGEIKANLVPLKTVRNKFSYGGKEYTNYDDMMFDTVSETIITSNWPVTKEETE